MSNENNNQFNQSQANNQQYYSNPQQPINYNQQQNPNIPPMPAPEEKASVGLAILSYLIPLVGLILYLTKKDTKPKTAKLCGKCALISFIINIVLSIIMYAVMGGAMLGGIMDAVDGDTDSSYSLDADEDSSKDNSSVSADGTIGDYKCVVKGAEMCKDWSGKDAILITYNFTNNSDDAISFDVALDARAYQNGIGLETAILDEDTDLLDVDIKPGITKEVKKAYVLSDTSSDVEIEISELISFNDDKIVTTVELPN